MIAGRACCAGRCCVGTSQVVNDWFDRHVDAINEPNRPIPSGRIPGRWGLYIAFLWTGASLAAGDSRSAPGDSAPPSLGLVLAWIYIVPPFRLKQNGWLGQRRLRHHL